MLAPINSIKHFVPQTSAQINSGTVTSHVIIDAVPQSSVATVADVVEGSIIKAVYVEIWIMNLGAAGPSQFILTIEKSPNGLAGPTFTNMANLMSYDNKKNILFSSQGILSDQNDGGNGAVPIHRSWIKIPKGKQRFGLGDRFLLSLAAVDANYRWCGMIIYKEYK